MTVKMLQNFYYSTKCNAKMLASVRCKIENIYYDFLKLLEKEQKYYRVASVIFLVAYLLSLLTPIVKLS